MTSGTATSATADLLRAAVDEGLVEVGNHGAYDEPAIGLSAADFDRKHAACDAFVDAVAGRRSPDARRRWLRPGSGLANGRILDWCDAHGYTCVLGNCYPHDPLPATRAVNAAYLRRRVRPGAVVILHDRWHTPATLRAYFAKPAPVALVTLSEALDESRR